MDYCVIRSSSQVPCVFQSVNGSDAQIIVELQTKWPKVRVLWNELNMLVFIIIIHYNNTAVAISYICNSDALKLCNTQFNHNID